MKKKSISLGLTILLLFMIFVMTACGNKNNEESSSSSDEQKNSNNTISNNYSKEIPQKASSPENAIQIVAEAINNKDAETIVNIVDFEEMYATMLFKEESIETAQVQAAMPGESLKPSESKVENNPIKTFDEALDYVKKNYDIDNELSRDKAIIRLLVAASNKAKVEIIDISEAKKVRDSDELYKCDVTFNAEAIIYGQKQSLKDFTDTIYVVNKDDDYYITFADKLFFKEYIVNYFYSSSGEITYGGIENLIEHETMHYYEDDNYQESTPAETFTEADFCEWINSDGNKYIIKDMDTSKKYIEDDVYNGDEKTLLVDAGKIYIYQPGYKSDPSYYYVQFKENEGLVEVDEVKEYVNGKWEDV